MIPVWKGVGEKKWGCFCLRFRLVCQSRVLAEMPGSPAFHGPFSSPKFQGGKGGKEGEGKWSLFGLRPEQLCKPRTQAEVPGGLPFTTPPLFSPGFQGGGDGMVSPVHAIVIGFESHLALYQ